MNDRMLFIGIDPGQYTTTCVIMDAGGEIAGVEQIYSCEEEYPRVARDHRKKGQRLHDPLGEQIAEDHFAFMYMVIDKYKPEAIGAENMLWTGGSNVEAMVGHFRGVMHGAAIIKGVPFMLITPSQIKKYVTGKGTANKKEMVEKIWDRYQGRLCELFPGLTKSKLQKNNHVADACGAALVTVSTTMGWLSESEESSLLERAAA